MNNFLTESRRALLLASALSVTSASAQAPSSYAPAPGSNTPGSSAPAPGSKAPAPGYEGVVPGNDNVPETVTAKPGNDRVVTWPGFQMMPDGSSRVFVQTTIEVKPELKRAGSGYIVTIPGVVLAAGNARLPLDTQYFNTPVRNVRAKQIGGGGVGIFIEMRANVQPKVSTERAPNGFFFVLIEFPPGTYK